MTNIKFKQGNPNNPKWINFDNGRIYRLPTEKEKFKPQLIASLGFVLGCVMFYVVAFSGFGNIISNVVGPIVAFFFLVAMPIIVFAKTKRKH